MACSLFKIPCREAARSLTSLLDTSTKWAGKKDVPSPLIERARRRKTNLAKPVEPSRSMEEALHVTIVDGPDLA